MPMNTTLVMMRSPSGVLARARDSPATPGRRSRRPSRLRLKPCCAGRAERAVERAADLDRDAQRAAVGLRDEHHLDGLAVVARAAATCACRRRRPASSRSPARATSARSRELRAEVLARDRSSRAKSASPRLYIHFMSWRARNGFSPSPPTNASSSARVRPSRLVRVGGVSCTSIGRGVSALRGQSSVSAKKYAISRAAFSALSEPCTMFCFDARRRGRRGSCPARPSSGRWRP